MVRVRHTRPKHSTSSTSLEFSKSTPAPSPASTSPTTPRLTGIVRGSLVLYRQLLVGNPLPLLLSSPVSLGLELGARAAGRRSTTGRGAWRSCNSGGGGRF